MRDAVRTPFRTPVAPTRRSALALLAAASLAISGCATHSTAGVTEDGRTGEEDPAHRAQRRGRVGTALAVIGVVAAAAAVGGAVMGQRTEQSLEDELARGMVTRTRFLERDDDGERWNRVARAGTYTAGLCALGLGVLWEMAVGDRAAFGPREPTPADEMKPFLPMPGGPAPSPPAPSAAPPPQ